MHEALLDLLRSPVDGSTFALEEAGRDGAEIMDGWLVDGSGARFPIVAGVPSFALALADDPTFGFKWRRIGDSYGHD